MELHDWIDGSKKVEVNRTCSQNHLKKEIFLSVAPKKKKTDKSGKPMAYSSDSRMLK